MITGIDIASELLLIGTSGAYGDGAIAELRRPSPRVSAAEPQRSCQIGAGRSSSDHMPLSGRAGSRLA